VDPVTHLGIREPEFAINDRNAIVGVAYDGNDVHAVRFTHAGIVRLEDEVVNLGDWRLENALGINNQGVIVGWGMRSDGLGHTFMLVPVPAGSDPAQWEAQVPTRP